MVSVPVLLVKDAHPYRHPKILAAIDPTHAFAKPPNSIEKSCGSPLRSVSSWAEFCTRCMPSCPFRS